MEQGIRKLQRFEYLKVVAISRNIKSAIMPGFYKSGHNKMHAELRWALFGILITHVHMESIKNVAVSDLVSLFLLPE